MTHREFSQADTYVNLQLRKQTCRESAVHDYRTAFEYCRDVIKDYTQEHFIAIYLDNQLHPICWRELNIGDGKTCNVDTLTLVQTALLCGAEQVIVLHNHPSGQIVPSPADYRFTDTCYEHLEWLHIELVDSIIVGDWQNPEAFYSFYRDDNRPSSQYTLQRKREETAAL
ncbi:MAG: hypothetical protein IJ727_06885 [Treponema sp.]|nr:hypothetical protein [Treponema sp.]